MKKITLLFSILTCFVFSMQSNAQILNQNASWPNATWTITGSYSTDPLAFESDPTIDSNFAFDDDDAGNNHEDNIAAESPIIDLTAAYAAGETWLTVTTDYVYNYLADDELVFQYWDADALAWVNWGPSFDTLGTTTTLLDDFCSGTSQTYMSPVLNILGFTATQQSGFRYRISYDDNPNGIDWNYGFCFQSPTITSATPPACPAPTTLTATNITTGSADLGWTENGTASSWDVEIVDVTGGGTQTMTPTQTGVANPYMAMSLTPANDYEFYVRADCTGSTSSWTGPFGFRTLALPPANDECADAIGLTVNTDLNCGTVTAGTIAAATDSGVAGSTCGGTDDDDVWYSFMATSTSHTISLTNVANGTTDLYHAVYDAAPGCGSLGAALVCSDPNTSTVGGLTVGNTYYVQVYSWTATAGQTSTFDICIGTPPPPPANDDCANAETITIGSSCTTITTSTSTATEGANELTTCDAFGNFGLWYAFVGPANGNLEFTSITGSPGVVIYSGADCTSLTEVAGTCLNNASGSITGLTPGADYYAMVWTDSAQATVEFCLFSLQCAPAVATASVGTSDCVTDNTYNVDVNITDLGSSTNLVVSNDAGLADQTVTTTGIVNVGPIPVGTSVVITLVNETDTACDVVLPAVSFECPPANDECSGAISLTPGNVFSDNPIDGTVVGASDDIEDVDNCGEPGPGVWYSVVVPNDGSITIETGPDVATGTTTFDSVIEVFTGNCGETFTSVDCDDDGAATANFSLLSLTGLTGGSTIYIRVWEYNGDETEPFSISAYSSTLSTANVTAPNGFTYFPNPVKQTLSLRAQNNIQNVSVYNMLGQEVLRTAPNTVSNDLNMSALQTGAYFVKVTINGATETIRVIKQ